MTLSTTILYEAHQTDSFAIEGVTAGELLTMRPRRSHAMNRCLLPFTLTPFNFLIVLGFKIKAQIPEIKSCFVPTTPDVIVR